MYCHYFRRNLWHNSITLCVRTSPVSPIVDVLLHQTAITSTHNVTTSILLKYFQGTQVVCTAWTVIEYFQEKSLPSNQAFSEYFISISSALKTSKFGFINSSIDLGLYVSWYLKWGREDLNSQPYSPPCKSSLSVIYLPLPMLTKCRKPLILALESKMCD